MIRPHDVAVGRPAPFLKGWVSGLRTPGPLLVPVNPVVDGAHASGMILGTKKHGLEPSLRLGVMKEAILAPFHESAPPTSIVVLRNGLAEFIIMLQESWTAASHLLSHDLRQVNIGFQ